MVFNPQQFLAQTVNAPMATKVKLCPEGEFTAMISTKIPLLEWFEEAEWKDKSGVTKSQPTAKIPVEIIDPKARELLGRETIMVTYDMFLDLRPDGGLDTGEDKNVRLGALRDALDQNNDSNWTWERLFGAGPFIAKVVHQASKKNEGDSFAKVSRVARLR